MRQRCRPPHRLQPASHGPHVREAQSDMHADPPPTRPRASPTPRLRRLLGRHHRLPLPVPTRKPDPAEPERSCLARHGGDAGAGASCDKCEVRCAPDSAIRRPGPLRHASSKSPMAADPSPRTDCPNGAHAACPAGNTERRHAEQICASEIGRSGAGWRPYSALRRRATVRLGRVFWDTLAIAVAQLGGRHQGRALHT